MKWKGKTYKQIEEINGCYGCDFHKIKTDSDRNIDSPSYNQQEEKNTCTSISIIYKEITTYKRRTLIINN